MDFGRTSTRWSQAHLTTRLGRALSSRRGPEAVLPRLPRPRVVPRRRRGSRGRRRRRPAARRRRVRRRRRARSAAGSSTSSSRTSTPTSSPATSSCATASAHASTSAPGPRPSTRSRRSPTATPSTSGSVRLVALETPGHSPESISILVYDLDADAEQPARRADAATRSSSATSAAPTSARRSAGAPRSSARCSTTRSSEKLLPLPDETLVYPAHGAGSLCGKNLSTDTVSTIGVQRRYNYALQPMSREEFVRVVTADQPDSPAYFTYDAVLNAKERPTLDEALAEGLTPLSLDDGARARRPRRAASRHARRPSTSRARISPAASTSASTGASRPGRARCSTTSARS